MGTIFSVKFYFELIITPLQATCQEKLTIRVSHLKEGIYYFHQSHTIYLRINKHKLARLQINHDYIISSPYF